MDGKAFDRWHPQGYAANTMALKRQELRNWAGGPAYQLGTSEQSGDELSRKHDTIHVDF